MKEKREKRIVTLHLAKAVLVTFSFLSCFTLTDAAP